MTTMIPIFGGVVRMVYCEDLAFLPLGDQRKRSTQAFAPTAFLRATPPDEDAVEVRRSRVHHLVPVQLHHRARIAWAIAFSEVQPVPESIGSAASHHDSE